MLVKGGHTEAGWWQGGGRWGTPWGSTPGVTIYWTWAYARVCKSGGTLLATYPTCWVVSPVHLIRVTGWSTVDIPPHPHLSACLVAIALMYAGMQTNIS